jgi:hypothetical protein
VLIGYQPADQCKQNRLVRHSAVVCTYAAPLAVGLAMIIIAPNSAQRIAEITLPHILKDTLKSFIKRSYPSRDVSECNVMR